MQHRPRERDQVIETELKISLDEAGEAALAAHAALERMRVRPRRTEDLVSTYFDTPDQSLAKAGIALRLRKIGRRWVQTVKREDPGAAKAHGLFSHVEVEFPAPGGKLILDGPDDQGVFAAIAEAAGGAELAPLFETRVRRIVERLAAPGGGEVELAIDRGEIVAGESRAPIREAEMELMSGDVTAVFEIARVLFREGPLRFATANKAARGYRLAATGTADLPLEPRSAGDLRYDADTPIETVARDVLRDCFAQISVNMVVVAESEAPEGPHQLRVGLRRLRTALDVLGPSLGGSAIEALSEKARSFGHVVGALRDIDVLIGDVVGPGTAGGLDAAARDALLAALDGRRDAVRAEVRAALAGPEALDFVLDLMRLVEARGWLEPSDYSQTARLATPTGEIASRLMDRACPPGAKKGPQAAPSVGRGAARAAQGAEKTPLRRGYPRSDLSAQEVRRLHQVAQEAAGHVRQPQRRGHGGGIPCRAGRSGPGRSRHPAGRRLGAGTARFKGRRGPPAALRPVGQVREDKAVLDLIPGASATRMPVALQFGRLRGPNCRSLPPARPS